jgi:hypothetical protein
MDFPVFPRILKKVLRNNVPTVVCKKYTVWSNRNTLVTLQVHFAQQLHGAGAANESHKDVTAHTRAILAPFCSRLRTQRARNKLEHLLAVM